MKRQISTMLFMLFALSHTPVSLANEALAPVQASGQPRQLGSAGVGFMDYVQMFLGLALVLGLIVGMAWLIRRMGSITQVGQGALKVVGGLSLGQREKIVLVQIGEETQILVGLAPGQIRTLHVLDKPISVNTPATKVPGGFAEKLQGLMQQGKGKG